MADLKISQLTGASTPLAGTEVLPIVQSGSTKKVSVADLTLGRAVASAGGTFSDNFVQGTAAKGVNFTANTPAAGMTSQLLNWYEEGTWTPSITFGNASVGVSYDFQTGLYTRIGNMVMLTCYIDLSNKGSSTGAARIAGLPFTVANNNGAYSAGSLWFDAITYSGVVNCYANINATTVDILQATEAGAASALTDTNFADTSRIIFSIMYRAA